MTVGQVANINGEDLGKALGPKRAGLVRDWLGRSDQNLSQRVTAESLRSVRGLGPKTLKTLQALVDGSWYTKGGKA